MRNYRTTEPNHGRLSAARSAVGANNLLGLKFSDAQIDHSSDPEL